MLVVISVLGSLFQYFVGMPAIRLPGTTSSALLMDVWKPTVEAACLARWGFVTPCYKTTLRYHANKRTACADSVLTQLWQKTS